VSGKGEKREKEEARELILGCDTKMVTDDLGEGKKGDRRARNKLPTA